MIDKANVRGLARSHSELRRGPRRQIGASKPAEGAYDCGLGATKQIFDDK